MYRPGAYHEVQIQGAPSTLITQHETLNLILNELETHFYLFMNFGTCAGNKRAVHGHLHCDIQHPN
jgi:hypothetical protein